MEYTVMNKLSELHDMVLSLRPRPLERQAYKKLVLEERTTIQACAEDQDDVTCFAALAHIRLDNILQDYERLDDLLQEGYHHFETVHVENVYQHQDFILRKLHDLIHENHVQNLEIYVAIVHFHQYLHCLMDFH